MSAAVIAGAFSLGRDLIARLIPDPEQRAKAERALEQMKEDGSLQRLGARMSAITAEANSEDPWTSRARPTFLYVMYTMMLASIPMGFLHAYSPETATAIAAGMKAWLAAIPEPMWALFGAGYLGYAWSRTKDKQHRGQRADPL